MADEETIMDEEDTSDSRSHGTSSPIMFDLEKLADKVSQLMCDELRLEMARGQSIARRGGR